MVYIESGMDFTPLFDTDKSKVFYIEKSDLYQALNQGQEGVKSVEFVMKKGRKIQFIECKGSFPNSANPEKKEEIEIQCQKLYNKLHHSLDLLLAKQVGISKHLNYEFAKELGNPEVLDVNLSGTKIIFLVVMGKNEKTKEWYKKEWCKQVQKVLNNKLIPLRKIWDIDVLVIDNEQARKRQMIA